MRVVLSDQDLAAKVNAFREKGKYVNRNQICKEFGTTVVRLTKLHKLGLIAALPAPMSPSIAATLRRKQNKTGATWFINKPAPWMKAA